MDCVIALEA